MKYGSILLCLVAVLLLATPPASTNAQIGAGGLQGIDVGALPPEVLAQIKGASQQGSMPAMTQDGGEMEAPRYASETEPPADVSRKPKDEAAPSSIELLYRERYNAADASELSQFGYSLFQSGRQRQSSIIVPDDSYVLGPGDILKVRVWGKDIDSQSEVTIAADGTANLPRYGVISLAGTSFGQADEIVLQEIEKYTKGVNVSVSLEKLRSVEVYVVGEIEVPGMHNVPAFSTILGGLYSAGGVKKSGSLRGIKLFRAGKLYKTLDVYDLLLRGDRISDVLLQDRDVLFVPRIGPTAAVAGAVTEPGIYEFKDHISLGQLFDLAGGILPQSFTGRVYLRRFVENRDFVVKDLHVSGPKADWSKVDVRDGDLLELDFLISDWPDAVYLEGNVWQAEQIRYQDGMTLSQVLRGTKQLKPGSFMDYGFLYRYRPESTTFDVKRFPIADLLSGSFDMPLQTRDRVVVLSKSELGIRETVESEGAVWRAGAYDYRPGMKVSDLIALSGGVNREVVYRDTIYLFRYDRSTGSRNLRRLSLSAVEAGGEDIELSPGDSVKVLSRQEFEILYPVTVQGAVWKTGKYEFHPGLTVADAVNLAGGAVFGAKTDTVEVSRQIIENDSVVTRHIKIDMATEGGFELKPYDYIMVPQIGGATTERIVTLSGEIRFPGEYRIASGERLSDVIRRAGGFTEDAYFFGAKFTSERARAIQQESLERLIQQLEIRANTVLSEQAQNATDNEDVAAAKAAQSTVMSLVDKLKSIKAEGRVTIRLSDMGSFIGTSFDFPLENGDALDVPQRPNYVAVVGSVYSAKSHLYEPGKTLGYYLQQSGGPTHTADADNMYVLRANGEVIAKAGTSVFGKSFEDLELMPGDTIAVPEDLERISYMRLVRDVSDIMFKVATTVGVVVAAGL